VQEGEQLLTLAEARVLRGHRLLDLDDQVGRVEDLVGARHDLGTDGGVLVVGEPRADAGTGLHDDLVTVVHELHDAVGRQRHPLLVVLDLSRYSDDERAHGESPPVGVRCAGTGVLVVGRDVRPACR
jgi:hypothetical protein